MRDGDGDSGGLEIMLGSVKAFVFANLDSDIGVITSIDLAKSASPIRR